VSDSDQQCKQAHVNDAVALMVAAADKLERLVADATGLPWKVGDEHDEGGWAIDGTSRINGSALPVAGHGREGGGVWDREDANLIATMANAGTALIAALRAGAEQAAAVGPDPHLADLARKILREGET
jgi:hypothetical protein